MNIFKNILHLPSTIAGGLVAGVGIAITLIDPTTPMGQLVQSVSMNYPKAAAALSILTGLALILGVGPKAAK